MQLEMKNIFKSFGANLVLDDVSFTLPEGHIVALLGENGAGKSTLMNILGGVLQADSGKIFLDGEEVTFSNPKESLDRKIAFIHQELNLINDLPIYENLFIGRELRKPNHFLDHEAMIAETKKLFEEMDLDLDPQTMVRDLDASYKQITEISRAMLMDARIVIMDEPTTSLTGSEISRVFTLMRKLRDMGVGIIFISHKLNEVMEICDSYTILRDGHMIRSGLVSETSTKQIASLMVGHEVNEGEKAASSQAGQVVMKAEGLGDGRSFADIDFEIRSGEVVGFTGLLGDGRSELFQAIFGSGSQISIELGIPRASVSTTLEHFSGMDGLRVELNIPFTLVIQQSGGWELRLEFDPTFVQELRIGVSASVDVIWDNWWYIVWWIDEFEVTANVDVYTFTDIDIDVDVITDDGRMVFERQYRHGRGEVGYEIPAGVCEPGESPEQAARRELLEETGYGEGSWRLNMIAAPNPSTSNNLCYSFIATGVRRLDSQHLEATEDIAVHLLYEDEVLRLMRSGRIIQAPMLCSLWKYFAEKR